MSAPCFDPRCRVCGFERGHAGWCHLGRTDEPDDIEHWSKEAVTLYLARHGQTPLDVERSLQRILAKLDEVKP